MMPASQQGGLELSFDEVVALLRIHWRMIASCAMGCLALAAVYLFVTPPQYTATTLLLIDPRSNAISSQQIRATDANSESAHVETQVEVLRSERIARAVIVSENLGQLPEFSGKRSSLFSRVGLLLFAKPAAPTLPEKASQDPAPKSSEAAAISDPESEVPAGAVKAFGGRLTVKRASPTHIIEISFRHSDPKLAAQIANAVASSYLKEQLKQRDEIIHRTSQWLKQRAMELLSEAHAAETALLKFRGSHSANDAPSRIILRDLETTAQTYRSFSENFQKRFLETSQSGTFNLPDARVVSEAWPPIDKSHPKSLLTLAIAGAAGLSLGFLIALARGKGEESST
jgi:uncharacterized protein involved in exopolysaccharide biosynthesis